MFKVPSLFVDYRIQSNANNQITVTLSSEALLAALRSAAGQGANSALSNVELVMKCVFQVHLVLVCAALTRRVFFKGWRRRTTRRC